MLFIHINKARKNERGLTIVEVLVVAPLIVLIIGVSIGFMVSITGDGLRVAERNALAHSVQDALGKVEADTQVATGFLQNKTDASGNSFTATMSVTPYKSTGPLIMSALATTKSPLDPARALVYRNENGCSPDVITYNEKYTVTYVYFVNGGTLWKRTVMGTGTPCSSTQPWQRPSCAPNYTPSANCKAEDEAILTNVQSLEVQYFKDDAAATPINTISEATSIKTTIVSKDSVAGEEIDFGSSALASLPSTSNVATAPKNLGQNLVANPSFESNTVGWDSNTAFGYYTSATYARSTLRASDGIASLEVTLPTGARSWVNTSYAGLIADKIYRFQVDVWIPSGTSDPGINIAFESNQDPVSVPRNTWTTLTFYWKATDANTKFFGPAIQSTTNGQKMWVDNMRLQVVN